MIWSEKKTVSPHDLDENDIASASAVLRYLQDAAYGQMYANPPSMNELRLEGKTFLLSRTSLSIYAPLRVYDDIVSESWACDSRGASYLRCGRLRRNGETVAELSAVWALVDIRTRALLRVSEYPQSYTNEPPLTLCTPRLRIPKETPLLRVGEYTALYRDADVNLHINNTNYPDILCSFLPDMKNKRVSQLSVNYCHEAAIGDTLGVYSAVEADTGAVLFRTLRPDGQTNVEARLCLCSISEE